LATNFGLSPLVAKSVGVISDARLSGRTDSAIVIERMLSISGEDALTVDRKHREQITCKLSTRLMLLTNELPRLTDSSGALASRFIVLRLRESFYRREDHALFDKLSLELPGILLWAIEGWRRLRERGHFSQPESGRELAGEMEDLTSPVGVFIRDCCDVGQIHEVGVNDIFSAWKKWCEVNGRREAGTIQTFGRDLSAAVPSLRRARPRADGERVRVYEGISLKPFD
jgi:putative DNA primase/helicase